MNISLFSLSDEARLAWPLFLTDFLDHSRLWHDHQLADGCIFPRLRQLKHDFHLLTLTSDRNLVLLYFDASARVVLAVFI